MDRIERLYDPDGKRKYLNNAEREAFYKASKKQPKEVKTLCRFLYWTGCRISEALELTADRVDIPNGEFVIKSLKKKDGKVHYRPIPVPQEFMNELTTVHNLQSHSTARLWTWHRSHAWRLVKKTMQDAGIDISKPHGTCKGMRHAYGLDKIKQGMDINTLCLLMGHADIKTTAIYCTPVGDDLRDIVKKTW
jgi:site-specific recombinase XerD